MDFWLKLLETTDFPARWNCGRWTAGHGWLHILSDVGIWGAYFAIPCLLAYFVLKRTDIPFRKIFVLFVAFILLCGMTHLMEAIIFWHPVYRLAGVIKFLTAVVSWGTVFALVQIVPRALAMRSSEELEREIAARKKVEDELQRANRELELRVEERTAELAAAKARSESALHHVLDGILTIDARGTIQSFNPAAERVFAYRTDEVIGQNVKMLMPEPYHSEHDDYLTHYLESGDAKIIGSGREVVGRRKDGSTFPMDLAVSKYTLGGRRYFTGIVRDISQQKRVEDQLRQIAAELSEANRRKDQFLATLAHELRNPLAPISTGIEVIKLTKGGPEQLNDVCQTMERQTQQLVTLVDDLLDVSRITRGKVRLRKSRVPLKDVLESAVEAARPFIDEANHELRVTLPDDSIELDADPHRMAQVFSNLLNNAAKYTNDGGQISLTAERQGHEVMVAIKDSGIGIPREKLDEIFEMFAQIDRASEKSHSGLGIGLTIVKSLIEMHNGRIEVESKGRNQGSEFQVYLPIPTESPSSVPEPTQQVRMNNKSRRVLIVDDNRAAADMLSRMVELLGHEVRTAYDGREAIESAAAFCPEVVLMDIGMPGMNGYEAARHMRNETWGQGTTLIALTGWGQNEDKLRTKEAGFDHHLVKPAELAEIQSLLTQPKP